MNSLVLINAIVASYEPKARSGRQSHRGYFVAALLAVAQMFLGILCVLLPERAFCEGMFFLQSGPLPLSTPNYSEQQEELVAQLKQKAVVEWLQGYLKTRYPQYERMITPDFGEKFISDYKVGRALNDKNRIEIKGRVDVTALREWAREMETKQKGFSSRTLFILSSELPGLSLAPLDSHRTVRDVSLGQTLFSVLTQALQKSNIRLELMEVFGLSLPPPRRQSQLKNLADIHQSTKAFSLLWVHLTSAGENQVKLDSYFFQLIPPRLVLSRTDEFKLATSDLNKSEVVRNAFSSPFESLRSDLKDVVSSGNLLSTKYRIVFEPIDSYKNFKQIEALLSDAEFIAQSYLRVASSSSAEFEIMSPLGIDELKEKLSRINFSGTKARILPY